MRPPHGTHITFYRLLLAAYQARERIHEQGAFSSTTDPAITAILCVSAVEAMLGELAQIAVVAEHHHYGDGSQLRAGLRRYAESYAVMIRERRPDQIKNGLNAAVQELVGQPVEWGKPPLQDFKLLVDLRNDIVHGNLGEIVVLDEMSAVQPQRRKTIMELQRKGLIHSDKNDPQAAKSSFDMAMTLNLADWAVKTTRKVIGAVMNPQHVSDAGPELQALFCLDLSFPMVLAANGIADD